MPLGNASFIYDAGGNQVQKLTGAQNRVSISIEEIPLDMQHAIVAVEDARFMSTTALIRAVSSVLFVVGVSHGFHFTEGQHDHTAALKNNVFTRLDGRDADAELQAEDPGTVPGAEAGKTLTAEGENAKDVILENYLNTINLGSGCYGVQTAAQTYFGKGCKDLTLSECAVLCRNSKGRRHIIRKTTRRKTSSAATRSLNNRKEQGLHHRRRIHHCHERQRLRPHRHAHAVPGRRARRTPTLSMRVITNLINDLMVQKGYTEVQAKNVVYSGGLKIYTTQDSYMQSIPRYGIPESGELPGEHADRSRLGAHRRAGRRRGTELQQRDAAALLPQQQSEFRSAL